MKYALSISDLVVNLNGKSILDNINLEISEGESICIIGESGSGKSVLIKTIIGLIQHDNGVILINNRDIKDYKSAIHNCGVVFQNNALFDSLPVWENISFSFSKRFNITSKAAKDFASEKLQMVGLGADLLYMYPSELSGGMRKRVGIARAIAHNPSIVILDEPTSGLDPIMSNIIIDIILKLSSNPNFTTIIVTHNISSAFKIADKIAVIKKGRIIAYDKVDKIKNSRDSYVKNFIQCNVPCN